MKKLLIANSGGIGIRAARAAREFGVAPVAVYSYEDRLALHQRVADEAHQIGEPRHPGRSYLAIEELVEIAVRSGAVYTKCGFLSESAVFAQAVVDADLTWVGPSTGMLVFTETQARGRETSRLTSRQNLTWRHR